MSKAIENLEAAFQRAMAIRPKVGFQSRGTDCSASDRPGRKQHVPRVSGRIVARRSRSLRCRLCGSHRRILRLQRRRVHRVLSRPVDLKAQTSA
jgi:hypothetical protein